MAAVKKKVVRAQTLKTTNQDLTGKNWTTEIHEITGDGTDTTYVLTTDLKVIESFHSCSIDTTAPFAGQLASTLVITDTDGVKTVTFASFVSLTAAATPDTLTGVGTAKAIANGKKVRVTLYGII